MTILRSSNTFSNAICKRFPTICLTVGDAFYNMRSSLDQLVWSLAKRPGGILDPQHTQFPILETDNSDTRKRFARQTEGVPTAAQDEIRGFQPFHRGIDCKSHPLWRLNQMCNLDKHRRIPANGSALLVHFPNVTRDMVGVQSIYGGTIVENLRVSALGLTIMASWQACHSLRRTNYECIQP
jgi:hypothetical protein